LRTVEVPGGQALRLRHLVLDLNGTLADRGELIEGVSERLALLARDLELHFVTADTRGRAKELSTTLGRTVTTIADGAVKADLVRALGAEATVAIGNGRNDEPMLREAALGIAVIGAEGAATATLLAADIVCRSVLDALDLLLDDEALVATLRP
jgi:P-type E1-E2 ATPase